VRGKTYDLTRLAASGYFDTSVCTRFYYHAQEYYDSLTDFALNYSRDLSNYTPAFVVNSDPDREEFLKECFEIRADFMRLGLTALLESLGTLENAAITRNFKEFSDGQITLFATLQIAKDTIKESAMRWKVSKR
jgi:hypothetical protein